MDLKSFFKGGIIVEPVVRMTRMALIGVFDLSNINLGEKVV